MKDPRSSHEKMGLSPSPTFGSHRPGRNRDIDIEKSPPACKLDLSKLEGEAQDELRNYLKDWGTTLW